jgi:hypothetical protein
VLFDVSEACLLTTSLLRAVACFQTLVLLHVLVSISSGTLKLMTEHAAQVDRFKQLHDMSESVTKVTGTASMHAYGSSNQCKQLLKTRD